MALIISIITLVKIKEGSEFFKKKTLILQFWKNSGTKRRIFFYYGYVTKVITQNFMLAVFTVLIGMIQLSSTTSGTISGMLMIYQSFWVEIGTVPALRSRPDPIRMY
jgi:hypothetical protein